MRTKELTRGLTREIHVSTKGAEDGGMPDTPEMAPPVGMDTEEEAMASGIGDATTAKEGLVCVECGELAGAFNWLYTRRPTFFNDAPLWKEDVEALQWSGKRLAGDSFYEATCAKCSAVSGTERLQRLQIPWYVHHRSRSRVSNFWTGPML